MHTKMCSIAKMPCNHKNVLPVLPCTLYAKCNLTISLEDVGKPSLPILEGFPSLVSTGVMVYLPGPGGFMGYGDLFSLMDLKKTFQNC